ncbi:MAG TPA: archease [Methanoregulaceae archaeon]|nr:archease [Methanoregulaceae archaeon]
MSYIELPHTADIRIRVTSETLEGLFSETAAVMMTIMYGRADPGTVRRSISIESDSTENLLMDFLSEVLFISEVDALVFSSVVVLLSGMRLTATLLGEPFDPGKHRGGTEIKGVSYSGLRILKEDTGYVLDILFDV